jgi:hypothetical protein
VTSQKADTWTHLDVPCALSAGEERESDDGIGRERLIHQCLQPGLVLRRAEVDAEKPGQRRQREAQFSPEGEQASAKARSIRPRARSRETG